MRAKKHVVDLCSEEESSQLRMSPEQPEKGTKTQKGDEENKLPLALCPYLREVARTTSH